MKKIIKLTETDLTRIVKRVIEEQPEEVDENISNKSEKIPTAEDFIQNFLHKNHKGNPGNSIEILMVEFAKMHVKEALEAAANEYYPKDKENFEIVAGRFINAYPIDKIK
jgi:hypothetical protein